MVGVSVTGVCSCRAERGSECLKVRHRTSWSVAGVRLTSGTCTLRSCSVTAEACREGRAPIAGAKSHSCQMGRGERMVEIVVHFFAANACTLFFPLFLFLPSLSSFHPPRPFPSPSFPQPHTLILPSPLPSSCSPSPPYCFFSQFSGLHKEQTPDPCAVAGIFGCNAGSMTHAARSGPGYVNINGYKVMLLSFSKTSFS